MARKRKDDSQKRERRVQFPSFTAEQADCFIELVKERLGSDLAGIIDGSTLNMNHLVRFMHVSHLCKTRRDQMGLSIKEVSSQLDIPQYRLKAIEGNQLSTIVPALLGRYVEFLGLEEEFQHWLEKNQDVYESLGENVDHGGDTKKIPQRGLLRRVRRQAHEETEDRNRSRWDHHGIGPEHRLLPTAHDLPV